MKIDTLRVDIVKSATFACGGLSSFPPEQVVLCRADVILEYDNHSGSHNDALTGYYQSCPVSCHE